VSVSRAGSSGRVVSACEVWRPPPHRAALSFEQAKYQRHLRIFAYVGIRLTKSSSVPVHVVAVHTVERVPARRFLQEVRNRRCLLLPLSSGLRVGPREGAMMIGMKVNAAQDRSAERRSGASPEA